MQIEKSLPHTHPGNDIFEPGGQKTGEKNIPHPDLKNGKPTCFHHKKNCF